MIYKFKPFSTTKELGKEYNAHCALVPYDDDWIAIMDYDTMFLDPLTWHVIERAIIKHPDTTIFGGVTNRVGYSFQRAGLFTEERMIPHYQKAHELAIKYLNGECKDVSSVAGFFLMFRKSYWNQNPFVERIMDNRGNLFDSLFCQKARKIGKIRIILGAYLLHFYRLNKDYRDNSHLK